jgi:pyruvate/2-oxoacid:ferredoxin oxidoreductase alpha subunit
MNQGNPMNADGFRNIANGIAVGTYNVDLATVRNVNPFTATNNRNIIPSARAADLVII